jgi:hypothetical protein
VYFVHNEGMAVLAAIVESLEAFRFIKWRFRPFMVWNGAYQTVGCTLPVYHRRQIAPFQGCT